MRHRVFAIGLLLGLVVAFPVPARPGPPPDLERRITVPARPPSPPRLTIPPANSYRMTVPPGSTYKRLTVPPPPSPRRLTVPPPSSPHKITAPPPSPPQRVVPKRFEREVPVSTPRRHRTAPAPKKVTAPPSTLPRGEGLERKGPAPVPRSYKPAPAAKKVTVPSPTKPQGEALEKKGPTSTPAAGPGAGPAPAAALVPTSSQAAYWAHFNQVGVQPIGKSNAATALASNSIAPRATAATAGGLIAASNAALADKTAPPAAHFLLAIMPPVPPTPPSTARTYSAHVNPGGEVIQQQMVEVRTRPYEPPPPPSTE
jgi:hypothetical protein